MPQTTKHETVPTKGLPDETKSPNKQEQTYAVCPSPAHQADRLNSYCAAGRGLS